MTDRDQDTVWDCLIIGGGPAGLTAAIYLARFHLTVLLVDAGLSRACLIPLTRNHAGYPGGIPGTELLERMAEQARLYRAGFRRGRIETLNRRGGQFIATTDEGEFHARSVLLATGVTNRQPSMLSADDHARGLREGLIRYCPICDGYEVTDQSVAVLGTGDHGCEEALFLRSYTSEITLIAPPSGHELSQEHYEQLQEAGVRVAGSCEAMALRDDQIVVTANGEPLSFASLYPALGSDVRSELAAQVGAKLAEAGCITVDAHQRTNVPGLYAAGDVVLGLDQISHAMGGGGVAATTIRNDLAAQTPLRR